MIGQASELHVGVTGTRHPLPGAQERTLGRTLATIATVLPGPLVLHHGVCTGADEAAHHRARAIGGWRIEGHPGHSADDRSPWRSAVAERDCDVLHPPRRYYLRNRDINAATRFLVAVPAYLQADPRSRASGTWQAVSDARARDHDVVYVWPDGTVIGWPQVLLAFAQELHR